MTIFVIKMHLRKLRLKVVNHRDFKTFENERLMISLQFLREKSADYIGKALTIPLKYVIHDIVLNTPAIKNKKYIHNIRINESFMIKRNAFHKQFCRKYF